MAPKDLETGLLVLEVVHSADTETTPYNGVESVLNSEKNYLVLFEVVIYTEWNFFVATAKNQFHQIACFGLRVTNNI